MKNAIIFHHGKRVGTLKEDAEGFLFSYDEGVDEPISLTFPLSGKVFHSTFLHPFFAGLLAEGPLRDQQCLLLKIDEEDELGLLIATGLDLIGSVTVAEDA